MLENRFSYQITTFAVVLAFIVVVLGAYTRLTNAGLGCPDWPGCYGHMIVTNKGGTIPTIKAWTEMVHRYCAGFLAITIMVISLTALIRFHKNHHPLFVPLLLLLFVGFQAALGMWTVTMKLLPIVVMTHLLGGLAILSLLWVLRLQLSRRFKFTIASTFVRQYRTWVFVGLLLLVGQIILGGWTSSNYAGISCIGFPYCNGVWLPHFHWAEAFTLFPVKGANYQGGLMSSEARVTIQMLHRFGAFLIAGYWSVIALWIFFTARSRQLQSMSLFILSFLVVQFSLGIMNVTHLLPLSVAVAHNAVAALLLLSVVSLNYGIFARHE